MSERSAEQPPVRGAAAAIQRLHARIRGRVQGVNFRYYTVREARALGLTGWVRNLPDGDVEVLAEGPREALERLLGFLRRGPVGARVRDLTCSWANADSQFRAFDISF